MDPVTLSQAGPVAILLAGITAMVLAFIRGDAVPGWLYRQEREARTRAEEQSAKTAEALTVLAKAAADASKGDRGSQGPDA